MTTDPQNSAINVSWHMRIARRAWLVCLLALCIQGGWPAIDMFAPFSIWAKFQRDWDDTDERNLLVFLFNAAFGLAIFAFDAHWIRWIALAVGLFSMTIFGIQSRRLHSAEQ